MWICHRQPLFPSIQTALARIVGKLPKTRIWDEVKKSVPYGQGAAAVRKMTKVLQDAGAMVKTKKERVKARKQKKLPSST